MISCKFVFGRQSLTSLILKRQTKCIPSAGLVSVRKNSTDIKQKRIGIIGMGQVGTEKIDFEITVAINTSIITFLRFCLLRIVFLLLTEVLFIRIFVSNFNICSLYL